MRFTERKVCFPRCDKQGNLTKVDYIKIKDKKLAEEKLCQLEDNEEELGIDLVFLTKLKQGTICYYNSIYGILECEITDIMLLSKKVVCHDKKKERAEVYTTRIYELTLEWYGKEWALTKEELE